MWWWSSRSKAHESDSENDEPGPQPESVHPAAAAILQLQQASGNQAVQQLLGGTEIAKGPTTEETDLQKSGVRVHTDDEAAKSAGTLGAAAYTRGRDIYFGAGKYAPETSEGKKLLAHELAHALSNEPGEELSRGVDAADVVAADDPSERAAESNAKSIVEGGASHLAPSTGSPPTAIHLAPLTEAEIAQKLHDAMEGLGTDEAAIMNLLTPLNRDAARIKKVRDAYVASFKTDLEADLRLELSGDDLAHALFLINAPPPATPAADTTVGKVGTEKLKEKVGDGEISVHTDVEYTSGATYSGGFSVGYEGKKSEEAHLLQFLWCEILATQPDGSVKHVAATGLPVAGGVTMDLTTSAASPKYKVDNGGGSTPFYESGGTDIRTSTGTTIYDRPSEFANVITKQFDDGATKVVEIDHFDDFLVSEYKTLFRVSLTVTWVYTSKTSVARTTDFLSGSAITGLPSAFRKQLIKEFPKFDYIQ